MRAIKTILATAILIVAFSLTSTAAEPRLDKGHWEYNVVLLKEQVVQSNPSEILNRLGAEGWELVAVADTVAISPTGAVPVTSHVLYFKRKLP